jgi:hypothetical protein
VWFRDVTLTEYNLMLTWGELPEFHVFNHMYCVEESEWMRKLQ